MKNPSRRRLLSVGAGLAALTSCSKKQEAPSALGAPMSPYGERSPREKSVRLTPPPDTKTPSTGASRTPLQDSYGIITPSALHFERHHSGIPDIDPAAHQLLIHGLVEQPLYYTVEDLKRFPSVTQIHFVECSGNGRTEYGNPAPTPQESHGLSSCSEWTGVPVKLLLAEAKLKPEAKWVIAEGADACRLTRSIPLDKLIDDAMIVYAQNGEPIRPAQGYPMRLFLPGWEGNTNIKWVHRLMAADGPSMTTHETAYYTDLLPNGKARQFSFELEAKSVITRPSGGQKLAFGPGQYEISGLAWSGRGKITRVEVSVDRGKTWKDAEMSQPAFSKAFTRFRLPWNWDGSATTLQSRCTDETGYLQPTADEMIEVRGRNFGYHNNSIKVWYIQADGSVSHVASA